MIEYDLGRTQAGKTVRTIDLYPPVSVQISGLRVGALLDPIICARAPAHIQNTKTRMFVCRNMQLLYGVDSVFV